MTVVPSEEVKDPLRIKGSCKEVLLELEPEILGVEWEEEDEPEAAKVTVVVTAAIKWSTNCCWTRDSVEGGLSSREVCLERDVAAGEGEGDERGEYCCCSWFKGREEMGGYDVNAFSSSPFPSGSTWVSRDSFFGSFFPSSSQRIKASSKWRVWEEMEDAWSSSSSSSPSVEQISSSSENTLFNTFFAFLVSKVPVSCLLLLMSNLFEFSSKSSKTEIPNVVRLSSSSSSLSKSKSNPVNEKCPMVGVLSLLLLSLCCRQHLISLDDEVQFFNGLTMKLPVRFLSWWLILVQAATECEASEFVTEGEEWQEIREVLPKSTWWSTKVDERTEEEGREEAMAADSAVLVIQVVFLFPFFLVSVSVVFPFSLSEGKNLLLECVKEWERCNSQRQESITSASRWWGSRTRRKRPTEQDWNVMFIDRFLLQ